MFHQSTCSGFQRFRSRAGLKSWNPPTLQATSTLTGHIRINSLFGLAVKTRLLDSSSEMSWERNFWLHRHRKWT